MTASAIRLGGWAVADASRAAGQLAQALALHAAAWALALLAWRAAPVLGAIAALPVAALTVRLFILQHDCGHGSFFPDRRWNRWTGRALALLTFTPFAYWRRFHALHHATSGRLDRRGEFDFRTLTLGEYRAMRPAARLGYRIYRHPLVLFGILPPVAFLVAYRLPWFAPRDWRRERHSILLTDAALLGFWGAVGWLAGWPAVVTIAGTAIVIASCGGFWLFFVQHQFEEGYWSEPGDWAFEAAGLHGSSCLQLPPLFRWITGDIGIHHLHHLDPRIPNYRLRDCDAAHRDLAGVSRFGWRDGVRCTRLALWDEAAGRMVPFPS